jgi:hypothetical protein
MGGSAGGKGVYRGILNRQDAKSAKLKKTKTPLPFSSLASWRFKSFSRLEIPSFHETIPNLAALARHPDHLAHRPAHRARRPAQRTRRPANPARRPAHRARRRIHLHHPGSHRFFSTVTITSPRIAPMINAAGGGESHFKKLSPCHPAG